MTFDDDFIQIETEAGPRRLWCKKIGLDWPPPSFITVGGFRWRLVRHSEISDEDRATMTHVCRGAEYHMEK